MPVKRTTACRHNALLPALLLLPYFFSSIGVLRAHLKVGNSSYSFLEKANTRDRTPRHRQDFWEKPESSCFHLDNVCHMNGTWFYHRRKSRPGINNNAHQHQPAMAYWQNTTTHGFKFLKRMPFSISTYKNDAVGNVGDDTTTSCPYHPTTNHMVLQSAHNAMMGEFYSRTILGLNQWMMHDNDFSLSTGNEIQMYIHFIVKMKQELMHGHHLLLGGLPNNNKFDNFYSVLEDDSSCQCFRKLIFCGYQVYNSSTSSITSNKGLGVHSDSNNETTIFGPHGLVRHPKTSCAFDMEPIDLETMNALPIKHCGEI